MCDLEWVCGLAQNLLSHHVRLLRTAGLPPRADKLRSSVRIAERRVIVIHRTSAPWEGRSRAARDDLGREGAAQALTEEVRYDADGNPETSTLATYPFMSATEVPTFELVGMETPTPYNSMGAKGIGEAGTIGATAAVHNAVIDAVAHLGVRHIDMPTTPQRVWKAINQRSTAKAGS